MFKTDIQEKLEINVVGAGLAGSECALQLADLGYKVNLFEMRNQQMTPAHKTSNFAELVCSNSFGSLNEISAPGQLKWEAQNLNSYILSIAKESMVPSGQALGVDRELFSNLVTKKIHQNTKIKIQNQKIESLEKLQGPTVIATGPLTDESLAASMQNHFGKEFLYFFDAIAPIIDTDSIDMTIAWKQDRYDKGTPDYINCPLNKDQYFHLIDEIEKAEKITPKHFETTQFFEGCMPIETMVERGRQTLRFGPMKPVGLKPPGAEREPFAVVQLRQDNTEGTAFNIVGFQTRMTYSEQARVFRLIPGLENAEFLKLGSIHRNLFINTPTLLNTDLSSRKNPFLFFAGQITGVEGYFESTVIGLLVARFLHYKLNWIKKNNIQINQFDSENQKTFQIDFQKNYPARSSAIGSLLNAITDQNRSKNFQPTNINFGLFPPLSDQTDKQILRDKKLKKSEQIKIAQQAFTEWKNNFKQND